MSKPKGKVEMIKDLNYRGKEVYLNVNNHYEGCALMTVERVQQLIKLFTFPLFFTSDSHEMVCGVFYLFVHQYALPTTESTRQEMGL